MLLRALVPVAALLASALGTPSAGAVSLPAQSHGVRLPGMTATPTTVVLYRSKSTRVDFRIDGFPSDSSPYGLEACYNYCEPPSTDGRVIYTSITRVDADSYAASLEFDKRHQTGTWYSYYTALVPIGDEETDFLEAPGPLLQVKRNTMMPAFNASPEPVRKGSSIRTAGRLTKLWPDVGYVGYGGKTIDVYFKPVGGTWTLKGSATTDSNGFWSRSFTASEDGSWQARFKGTSNYHRETSHSDYVDVQ